MSIIVRSDTAYQFVAKQVIELQKKKHKGIRNAMFSIESRRYVGNKFKLSAWIKENILENCTNLESLFDVFAGTGVVTKSMSDVFSMFYLNDFLYSNEVIYKGFF